MHGISFLSGNPQESYTSPTADAHVFSPGELFSNADPRYFDEGPVERDN
jgi:hypothetical protein